MSAGQQHAYLVAAEPLGCSKGANAIGGGGSVIPPYSMQMDFPTFA